MVSLAGENANLDANTVIYAIEGYAQYTNLTAGLLIPLDAGAFLRPSPNLHIEPISLPVLEKVIELRARHGLKIPDAIHLATGILAGCTVFVTCDASWAKTGVTVVEPQDVT